jgi:tetratricopeptide (TPR) repeat protein
MRAEIRQDIEFYTALANSRLALASREDQQLRDAGREMHGFVTANRRNYHYYEAIEVLGDLFAAVGRYDEAQTRYAALASTPWPEFKIRAGVLEGRALAAQGKHQEAIGRFDEALTLESDAAGVAEQRLAAMLGKATSQAELGQSVEAIGAVQDVIAAAEPEAVELQARAHNVLGLCHEKAGSSKEALYAFLYVDVLCSSVADAHAEALYHLIPLFQRAGRDEDSRRTREELLQKYPNSVWAKQLEGA